jgi:hypothetical protein
MQPVSAIVARRLRARYMLAGAMMLALWAASVIALFRDASALSIVATTVATLAFLPLGLVALQGGLSGGDAAMQRARNALFVSGGLLALIVAAEILRRMVFAGG